MVEDVGQNGIVNQPGIKILREMFCFLICISIYTTIVAIIIYIYPFVKDGVDIFYKDVNILNIL
jgi:hypothetical protein